MKVMADLQKHLQTLREQLDDSIRLYCQQQQQAAMNRSNRSGRSSSSVTVKSRRTLHMLHQDETSACIQISLLPRNPSIFLSCCYK
ncbi:unnamed protein product [Brugia pahangi]|uniref:G protein gamma domain-containing protein n=1 Tax=Brugia pahangi TaxID=6280 RepID=A0A0N4T572_BRUPA|nr:unnamed protein product [Brugia pahangi]